MPGKRGRISPGQERTLFTAFFGIISDMDLFKVKHLLRPPHRSKGPDKMAAMLKERLKLHPCQTGARGFCCKGCLMGPCRVTDQEKKGVCGASRDLIAARNLLRAVAAGAAAHCGHAQHMLDFTGGAVPRGYAPAGGAGSQFLEISEALHLSSMGVGADPAQLLRRCLKLAALDGLCGLSLATALEDKHFGKPEVKKGQLNLACLKPGKVNIAVHGHEPLLVQALAKEAARRPDVNLVGVCCTGAALLSRLGVPLAAAFTLQEDVVATGIVEAMIVDSQCVMPSLPDLCECFHTKLITTSELARLPGAIHMPVRSRKEAARTARKAIETARRNLKNRSTRAGTEFKIKAESPRDAVVGFCKDNIAAGRIAALLKSGAIKGVIAAVGCVNPRTDAAGWINAFRELSADHVILTTGCMAFELGRHGLLDGKKIFHMGSCVNNARIAAVFRHLAARLGGKMAEMPFLVSAPMPITEKSVSIGLYFATLGCDVHFGAPFPINPHTGAAEMLATILKEEFLSAAVLESSPGAFLRALKSPVPARQRLASRLK